MKATPAPPNYDPSNV